MLTYLVHFRKSYRIQINPGLFPNEDEYGTQLRLISKSVCDWSIYWPDYQYLYIKFQLSYCGHCVCLPLFIQPRSGSKPLRDKCSISHDSIFRGRRENKRRLQYSSIQKHQIYFVAIDRSNSDGTWHINNVLHMLLSLCVVGIRDMFYREA